MGSAPATGSPTSCGYSGPTTDYALNCYPNNGQPGANGSFAWQPGVKTPMSLITQYRGASNLILFGESALDPAAATSYVDGSAGGYESIFSAGMIGTNRSGGAIIQDLPGNLCGAAGVAGVGTQTNNWGSAHSGVAQFVMCDGHSRTISLTYSLSQDFIRSLQLYSKGAINLDQ